MVFHKQAKKLLQERNGVHDEKSVDVHRGSVLN